MPVCVSSAPPQPSPRQVMVLKTRPHTLRGRDRGLIGGQELLLYRLQQIEKSKAKCIVLQCGQSTAVSNSLDQEMLSCPLHRQLRLGDVPDEVGLGLPQQGNTARDVRGGHGRSRPT